jgi:uncharacterized protein
MPPVVAKVLKKGVLDHIAMTYILASPVLNPIVLVSTYVAFRGNVWMVLGRVVWVVIPAVVVGSLLANRKAEKILREKGTGNDVTLMRLHGYGNGHEHCVPIPNRNVGGCEKASGSLFTRRVLILLIGKVFMLDFAQLMTEGAHEKFAPFNNLPSHTYTKVPSNI